MKCVAPYAAAFAADRVLRLLGQGSGSGSAPLASASPPHSPACPPPDQLPSQRSRGRAVAPRLSQSSTKSRLKPVSAALSPFILSSSSFAIKLYAIPPGTPPRTPPVATRAQSSCEVTIA